MTLARPWLPANAVRDETLTRTIANVGECWAARWFRTPKPVSVRMNEAARQSPASAAQCWSAGDSDVALIMNDAAYVPIGCAMLGVEVGAHKVTAQDATLLKDIAALCVADLMQDLTHALVPASGFAANEGCEDEKRLRFTFSLGAASQLLELYLSEQLAVTARQRLAGKTSAPCAPLHTRADALSGQRLEVAAMVGESRLDLGELRALRIGDVVVLDHGPTDRVALAINGAARRETACSIVREGEELRLQLATPEPNGLS